MQLFRARSWSPVPAPHPPLRSQFRSIFQRHACTSSLTTAKTRRSRPSRGPEQPLPHNLGRQAAQPLVELSPPRATGPKGSRPHPNPSKTRKNDQKRSPKNQADWRVIKNDELRSKTCFSQLQGHRQPPNRSRPRRSTRMARPSTREEVNQEAKVSASLQNDCLCFRSMLFPFCGDVLFTERILDEASDAFFYFLLTDQSSSDAASSMAGMTAH